MDKKDLDRIITRMSGRSIPVIDAGITSYDEAFSIQSSLSKELLKKGLKGVILLLEHNPVITFGSNRNTDNLLASRQQLERSGINIVFSNRGGDITLHAPGQIVCYPVFNLGYFGKDLSRFVYNLEQVILETLLFFGLEGRRVKKHRGVFIKNRKVASVGLRVKKWVSIHGFSLNVDIDLSYFDHITACGLKDYPQASMSSLLGKRIAIDDVKEQIINSFKTVFDISIDKTDIR